MTSQELLNIGIFAVTGIFAIAFLLDFISMIVNCWKQSAPKPALTEEPQPQLEPPTPTTYTASIDWVQPDEVPEPLESINIIELAKTKAIATTDQLMQLPLNTLKAIAKTRKIKIGNCKKPETIIKKLGIVKRSEIPTT